MTFARQARAEARTSLGASRARKLARFECSARMFPLAEETRAPRVTNGIIFHRGLNFRPGGTFRRSTDRDG